MRVGASSRVLLVGCGELGSRHLQAVATLPEVAEIEVVDPRPEALAAAAARLQEVADRAPTTVVRWYTALDEAGNGGDLCIVATQAAGRCQLVQDIVQQLGYRRFLLEKIVGQSIREIEELLDFGRVWGLEVWVNLKTRAYPIHEHVRRRLGEGEPLLFNAVGGNHGLANNGVHTADLFVFYDGARRIDVGGAAIDPVLHPSKRGKNLFDLSGTLQGVTERGSHFTLSYARDHAQSEVISVGTRRYRCIVDHFHRWAVESDRTTGGSWRSVPFEGNLLVSHMTRAFARDILAAGGCRLPTLEESLPAHRFILGALQPAFRRLLEREVELAPVT
jgi:predicted dehydrogenase